MSTVALRVAVAHTEQAIEQGLASNKADVGQPGGPSPEEFQAYRAFANQQLRTLEKVNQLVDQPGMTADLLQGVTDKVRGMGQPGGPSAPDLAAYLTDVKFRCQFHLAGPAGSPYPAADKQLVTAINGVAATAQARENLLRDLSAKSSAVGQPGGPSPEEFQAYKQDMTQRIGQLDQLQNLLESGKLTQPLAQDVLNKVQSIGQPGGSSPARFDAYLTNIKFRAEHNIPGGPGSPYPAKDQRLVTAVNAVLAASSTRQNMLADIHAKAADVGQPGGPSPQEFDAYRLDMATRIGEVAQLEDLAKTGKLSQSQAQSVLQTAQRIGQPGGPGPAELSAYLQSMYQQIG